MKRNERNTLNQLKKSVTRDTVNVEVPVSFSEEARQAIHELLTSKGMKAVRINWNNIINEYAVHYIYSETAADQENKRIVDVERLLPKSDYTWNGYKKPDSATKKAAKDPVPTVSDKIRAAYNDAKARLAVGEEMHVHFSEGNSKTHIPSVDLLPLFTCHGRCRETCGKIQPGKALPPCYAAKIANRFPDALRNYAENTVLAIFKPDQYWQEVEQKMKVSRFMRLFVSGDMIINGYFTRLCDALERNPHVEMQGFSKCYEIVNREIEKRGALPRNLHLLLSGWYDMQPVNPHNLPTTNVYEKEKPESWLSCGGNCANCACVGLGCWKAQPGDVVGFKKH